ncbi:MAG: hypothetical protein IJ565_05135 [Bacilli bacterium]|nr:hypothetical protein [Bacilli bacterium]
MKTSKILWGLVFIIVGIILGLNAMGIANIEIFFNGWWTLFIIVPSFINIFREDHKVSSFIWFIIGIILLLACNDLITYDLIWKLMLPVILVLIGLSIIFKGNSEKVTDEEIEKLEVNDTVCSMFKEEIVKAPKKFDGVDLEAIFGSIKYDMSSVSLKKDALIKTCTVFGSVKIIVPKGVNVKMKKSGLFCDMLNKVKITDEKNTIIIDAFTLFGSVIIDDK